MINKLKRILKSGWINFYRNSSSSFAMTFILVVVISLITSLFIFRSLSDYLIEDITAKADIAVFLTENSGENEILELKTILSKLPEVKEAIYISQTEAYQDFLEKHKNDIVLMESLNEVGGNPFLASINIKAFQVSQYANVVSFLENYSDSDLINKIDYYQRKPVIERIFNLTSLMNKIGLGVALFLIIVTILVVFNTIKLAIFNSSQEISVMKLVGASNSFIRWPFLIQGIISGLFAIFTTSILSLLTFWFFSPKLEIVFGGFNPLVFYLSHFFLISLIQLAIGIGLSIIASFFAIRKYLKV